MGNRRPQYLNRSNSKQVAKLRILAMNDDPMERPLPAAMKSLNQHNHS